MGKPTGNERQDRLSTHSGRVTKRTWEPRESRIQRRTTKKESEITRTFLQENYPELLATLELPVNEVRSAASKFAAFVEVEQLANERDNPLRERLISSEVTIKDGYRIVQTIKDPDDPKKKTVVAFVDLAIGHYENASLAKEREAVILAAGNDEKEDAEGNVDSQPSDTTPMSQPEMPKEKKKSPLGRRVYGFIMKREPGTMTIRAMCRPSVLERLKKVPLKLYLDINTAAQKFQLEAIERVAETRYLQKKLAFEITPASPTPPIVPEVVPVVPTSSRSRSPSIIWLDDEIDAKSSSSDDSVICLDDFPEEEPPKPSTSETAIDESSNNNSKTDIDDDPVPLACLNVEQNQAVDEIIKFYTYSLFMLFGPPGTGKTFTLAKAIALLVQCGHRVLVCTPSNKAADVISCGILNEDIGLRRLYRYVSRTLDPSLVDPRVRSHAGIETDGDSVRFTPDNTLDLDDYDIVVSTLGSTPALRKFTSKSEREFSHIVIDEAGQAAEMEVWMPLAFFGSETTRLIVAGDPMQLGPVASVHLLDDPVYGYKNSILSRLYQNEAFRSDIQNMVQLTKNYRSHKSIVKVVSKIFYDKKLEYTCPAGHDSLIRYHRLPKKRFPVFFESIYGRVYTDSNGSSSNEVEAEAVVDYVESLLRYGVKANEIGVVSPYTAQTDLIRRRLGSSSEVTVDTVEKYQGSERRVIIVTAVRNGKALGFMEDRQRLNTALSRAQQLLIVIGHARSLKVLPDWKKFIKYCKDHKAYRKDSDTTDAKAY